jgi:hypothetical protein
MWMLMDPCPPPLLIVHTFLDIEHLYSTWVADATGFHSGRLTACILSVCI